MTTVFVQITRPLEWHMLDQPSWTSTAWKICRFINERSKRLMQFSTSPSDPVFNRHPDLREQMRESQEFDEIAAMLTGLMKHLEKDGRRRRG